jgi:hypothetical protein
VYTSLGDALAARPAPDTGLPRPLPLTPAAPRLAVVGRLYPGPLAAPSPSAAPTPSSSRFLKPASVSSPITCRGVHV